MSTVGNRLRTVHPVIGILLAGVVGLGSVPAMAATGIEGRVVELTRTQLELIRRVEPFDGSSVQERADRLVVTLDADVLFDFDEATLTSQAEETLAQLAEVIDDRLAGDEIAVVGFTDAKGTPDYNLDLSRRRAQAVQEFLSGVLDTDPSFAVEGRGEADPVAANELEDGSDNPEGRRRNRRVELSFEAEPPDGP